MARSFSPTAFRPIAPPRSQSLSGQDRQPDLAEDRSCGAGGQLGYQYSSGDYICLIDGDMRLYRGFLAAAIETLETNPTLAGVGGIIVEREAVNLEYVKRASSTDPDRHPGLVKWLDCGGVYRRAAIDRSDI